MAPGSYYKNEILPHPCKCGGDLYVLQAISKKFLFTAPKAVIRKISLSF
jgi:hypothetical protein